MSASEDLTDLVASALEETGRSLDEGREALQLEASTQLTQLALAVGEPGYDRAVVAARDNVALAAGLQAAAEADAADSRIIGIIQGALFFGAKAAL